MWVGLTHQFCPSEVSSCDQRGRENWVATPLVEIILTKSSQSEHDRPDTTLPAEVNDPPGNRFLPITIYILFVHGGLILTLYIAYKPTWSLQNVQQEYIIRNNGSLNSSLKKHGVEYSHDLTVQHTYQHYV